MNTLTYQQFSPHIGTITLSDPSSRNAMTEDMAVEFAQLVNDLSNQTRTLRAIIVTGAGSAFSSGGNLEMLEQKRQLSGEENRLRMLSFYRSFLGLRSLGVPLIAAINGHAIGAGLCIACACDIRIASLQAKLGVPFVRLGLYPGMGSTFLISGIVGHAKASELLLTGRIITGKEALEIGLVSEAVEPEEVLNRAIAIATEIASAGPSTIRHLIGTLRHPPSTLEEALLQEAAAQAISYASDEFAEGLLSARERRAPLFTSQT